MNIELQENAENKIEGQIGSDGEMYSDFIIFQRQSTEQESNVVSWR